MRNTEHNDAVSRPSGGELVQARLGELGSRAQSVLDDAGKKLDPILRLANPSADIVTGSPKTDMAVVWGAMLEQINAIEDTLSKLSRLVARVDL